MKSEELAKALIVTAEVTGHEMSRSAAHAMALDLDGYPDADVTEALRRCRREGKGRLTLAAILERMPGGHVGADEAWAIASRGEDESASIVWTDEIAEAFGVARGLLLDGDNVGARMAFRDTYTRLAQQSRDAGRKPQWWPTLGHDARGRKSAILEAVTRGRLPAESVQRYLPPGVKLPAELTAGIGRLPQ